MALLSAHQAAPSLPPLTSPTTRMEPVGGHTGRVGVQCTPGSYDNDGLQVIFPLVIPEIFYNHMI